MHINHSELTQYYLCIVNNSKVSKLLGNKVAVEDLINLIPDDKIRKLSKATNVDHQVKKLYGRSMFYLLLFGILDSTKVSLRNLEDIYNSTKFRFLFQIDSPENTKFNSISDRLSNMNADYFKDIYDDIYNRFSELYSEEDALSHSISRVDSTMVAEVSNKLQEGMRVGSKNNKKQIKYTVQLTDLFPSSIEIFTEQTALSEDYSIPSTILQNLDKHKDNIIVFDRGVAKRKFYTELDSQDIKFVTRIRETSRTELYSKNELKESQVNNLTITADEWVYLFDKNGKKSGPFRLIKSTSEKEKEIWFLTNHSSLTVSEVISVYRKRWDIEVFFRFIKQELNFSHFLSTSINGIKIVLYTTMILAMLILIYKKCNNLGYKRAVNRFKIELDELIIKSMITFCGGDPNLVFR